MAISAWTLLFGYFIVLCGCNLSILRPQYTNKIKSVIKPIIIFNFLNYFSILLYILTSAENLSWISYPSMGSGIIFHVFALSSFLHIHLGFHTESSKDLTSRLSVAYIVSRRAYLKMDTTMDPVSVQAAAP